MGREQKCEAVTVITLDYAPEASHQAFSGKLVSILQDGQVKLLKKFPTTDIATLIKQRELILSYAKTSPVSLGMARESEQDGARAAEAA